MCPWEGLHLSYVPVVESYQACQLGGQSKLTHTQIKHIHTHTKCLDTEGVTVCFIPVPEVVGGHRLTAIVIDLSPWVEYEFRVLASNTIGTGEPSKPSKQARTKGTCMYCMSRKKVSLCLFQKCVSCLLVLPFEDKHNWLLFVFLPRITLEDRYYSHVCLLNMRMQSGDG